MSGHESDFERLNNETNLPITAMSNKDGISAEGELLPCPFCSANLVEHEGVWQHPFTVCFAMGAIVGDAIALQTWNTRTLSEREAAKDAEIVRIRQVIRDRAALYATKRDQHSILAEDSLTVHEKFQHTVEAFEWLESELDRAALTKGQVDDQ